MSGKILDNPAFRSWFASSMVADAKGNPIVVYHGSPDLRFLKKDNVFKTRYQTFDMPDDAPAFYFTDSLSKAKSYANERNAFDYQNAEGGVMEFYLSIQNPLLLNAGGKAWRSFETEIIGQKLKGTREIVKYAHKNGFDGVIIKNVKDYYNNNDKITSTGTVYVAFSPEQIKLADGTNTTFEIGNPDIRYADGGLVASNGKPSNLIPEQYELVRTPEFKAWFGEWENDPESASKVVDENGEPLVLYHGTTDNFHVFKIGSTGGLFFTTERKTAERFSSGDLKRSGEDNIVLDCFLNIKKPYIVGKRDLTLELDYWDTYFKERPFITKANQKKILSDKGRFGWSEIVPFGIVNQEAKKLMIKYGYDGIVFNSNPTVKTYVAFYPEQIKLADGTNTTFDPKNADIRYDNGGVVGKIWNLQEFYDWSETVTQEMFGIPMITGFPVCDMQDVKDDNGNAAVIITYAYAQLEDNTDLFYNPQTNAWSKEQPQDTNAQKMNNFKKGGEINPDSSQAKEYFAHGSGAAGGVLVGKRHSEGGIKAINKSNGQAIEMEGGEVVITRDAVSDNEKREFEGEMLTNREILSKINQSGGGVPIFEDGGSVFKHICPCSGKKYNFGGNLVSDFDIVEDLRNSGLDVSASDSFEDRQRQYANLPSDSFKAGGKVRNRNEDEKKLLSMMKANGLSKITMHRDKFKKVKGLEKDGIIYSVPANDYCKEVRLTQYGSIVLSSLHEMHLKNSSPIVFDCTPSFKVGGSVDSEIKYFKGVKHKYDNQFQINKAIEELISTVDEDSLTPEERNFIGYYAGYGGLEKFGASGKGLLYEYFTPSEIAKKMWGLVYKHGFKGGRVLEPSCGIGEFIKYAPDRNMVTGFEINEFSAKICRILYPGTTIQTKPFETLFIKNNNTIRNNLSGVQKYSLVIGNPPYGSMGGIYAGMGEKKYTKANNYIDYFILRGLDLLEPSGILAYIIGTEVAAGGTPFLQQGNNPVKQQIAEKAYLVDAYRLPNGLFETTDVLTDIVIFKKK